MKENNRILFFFCYVFLSYTSKTLSNELLYNQGCYFISLLYDTAVCPQVYVWLEILTSCSLWISAGPGLKNIRLDFTDPCDEWAGNSFQYVALQMYGYKRLYAGFPRSALNVLVISGTNLLFLYKWVLSFLKGYHERK